MAATREQVEFSFAVTVLDKIGCRRGRRHDYGERGVGRLVVKNGRLVCGFFAKATDTDPRRMGTTKFFYME